MTSPPLLLSNADDPGQFKARRIKVIRSGLQIGRNLGVLVSIEEPLDGVVGGPLEVALLVPRNRSVRMEELAEGVVTHRADVFVCRYRGRIESMPSILTRDDVEIVFWGLVTALPGS
jgi:hypothetical protein